ncbi:hypothetical protein B1748_15195 [Paenibacillus sp. MY03]|uniref:hypothetical protein n=1 Tax=Paenibacillus sp. MY03 TaxID=302980 RepID=UPI000B3C7D4F|nr:hypothetical protein [Paenibacillus sp. MY03]OUS75772.1 hypothetical protein B1748_15195 [Paenibacillus sp. MY03]
MAQIPFNGNYANDLSIRNDEASISLWNPEVSRHFELRIIANLCDEVHIVLIYAKTAAYLYEFGVDQEPARECCNGSKILVFAKEELKGLLGQMI